MSGEPKYKLRVKELLDLVTEEHARCKTIQAKLDDLLVGSKEFKEKQKEIEKILDENDQRLKQARVITDSEYLKRVIFSGIMFAIATISLAIGNSDFGRGIHMQFYSAVAQIVPLVMLTIYLTDSAFNGAGTSRGAVANIIGFIVPAVISEAAALFALATNESKPVIALLTFYVLFQMGSIMIMNALSQGMDQVRK